MIMRDTTMDVAGLPLYQAVRNSLVSELQQGTWKPGEMLPTEIDLAAQYGVSLGTVRQAILSLVREGWLNRASGRGTFVARLDSSRSFARFFRFRGPSGRDEAPRIRLIDTEVLARAPDEALRNLRLDPGARVLRVQRLLLSGDVPVCLYRSFLPYDLVAGIEEEDLESDRLYALIEARKGLHVVRAEELLRAGVATEDEAAQLGIAQGNLIIRIERTAFSHGSTVLEWRETIGRSDTFHYKITMP